SDISTGTIGRLDPATGHIDLITVPEARGTTGIDVAPDGTVWFGVTGGQLGRLAPGTLQPVLYRLPPGDAYGVAVDKQGAVWVATSNTTVDAFSPQTETFRPVTTGAGAWWVVLGGDGAIWTVQGAAEGNTLGRITDPRAGSPLGLRTPPAAALPRVRPAMLAPQTWP
ncbi:MAG: Vgb family protein, partial [Dehalococcoidia bacterium]